MKQQYLHGSSSTKIKINARYMALVGLLSAMAIILMFFEIILPFMPPFLKFDISDLPVLVAGFALGPVAAVIVAFLKNVAHLPSSTSAYVGELANFVTTVLFAGTASWVYKKRADKKGALLGLVLGTLAMTLFMSIFNYFFMIDFYARLFGIPMEDIVGLTNKVNGLVTDLKTMIVFVFVPFNIFKGLVLSILTLLLYPRLRLLFKG